MVVCAASVLVSVLGSGTATATGTTPPLLGDWTFTSGSAQESTGYWSTFTLEGTASISSNGLAVTSNGSTGDQPSSSAWAEASGYSGPPIAAKTLVSWLKLDSTAGVGGGGLALEQYLGGASGDDGQFDALDYGEGPAFQWVPGSDNFTRTQIFSPGASDTATGVTTQVAISYSAGSGTETITGCLNGTTLGSYATANAATFSAANAPLVLFGPRSYDNVALEAAGGIDAHILESRIYGGAMTCAQIAASNLSPTVASVSPASADQGASGLDVTIDGTGFESFASGAANNPVASFSGSGITVNSTSYVSSSEVTANISISPGASLGADDVTVTNPDGGSATDVNAFTVDAPPSNAFTITSDTGSPNGTITLDVNVPGPGTVDVLGTHEDVTGHIASVLEPGHNRFAWGRLSATTMTAGTIKLTLKADRNGKKLLARHRHHSWALHVAVWVTYTPTGGYARSYEVHARVLKANKH
jgi:hypothetical protein